MGAAATAAKIILELIPILAKVMQTDTDSIRNELAKDPTIQSKASDKVLGEIVAELNRRHGSGI